MKVKDDGLTIDAVSVSQREEMNADVWIGIHVAQVMAENELGKGDTDHDQEIILKILKVSYLALYSGGHYF